MAQQTPNSTVHDVVVVGSGAGGGTVTKVLADLGVSVLLLEAGPMLNMADLKEHMWPHQVPHRGAGARGQAYTGGPTGFTYSATYGGAQPPAHSASSPERPALYVEFRKDGTPVDPSPWWAASKGEKVRG